MVQGNYIGVDATGASALGNGANGVFITTSASTNTVGGTTAEARNLISGNTTSGIHVLGIGVTGNIMRGNYIGTDVTGTVALGNGLHGVRIAAGASDNVVGGFGVGEGNLISGNATTPVAVDAGGGE